VTPPPIVQIERLDLTFAPRTWAFAEAKRAEIEAHFGRAQALRPALWNGRVLLLHDYAVTGGVLKGKYLETDFASFLAWRDWGYPDTSARNAFAQAALRSADGAFVLGVMGEQTANAGRIYFPSGTPEPADIVDGTVDLEFNLMRELEEETGLAASDVSVDAAWTMLDYGSRLALMRIMRSSEPADRLRERILGHVSTETQPELADVHIVRTLADLDSRMPDFVAAYLRHVLSGDAS
jgi:8-oxo-dGTP pyrophosphatase MutT (NUDIX family)